MKKNQLGYAALVAFFLVAFFFYNKACFLFISVFLFCFALGMRLFLEREASKIHLNFQIRPNRQKNNSLQLVLSAISEKRCWGTGYLEVEAEFEYTMFGRTEQKQWLFCLTKQKNSFEIPFRAQQYGEVRFRCVRARTKDLLMLFSADIAPLIDRDIVVYPLGVQLQVELLETLGGTMQEEQSVQNKKGNDHSEIFDLREYIPGDDLRSVHWKLSSKLGKFILREASAPMRYQVALLFDLSRMQGERSVLEQELNTAIAFGAALGEQFLQKNIEFCILFPSRERLQVCEVSREGDYRKALSQWMSVPIPEQSGTGLQYFRMEPLEQCFTKILVLSAGGYEQVLSEKERQTPVVVLNVTKNAKKVRTLLDHSYEIVEIPMHLRKEEVYHIVC